VHHSAGERTQVLQDVASDPTLPRTKTVRCAECGHGEAVFFQVKHRFLSSILLYTGCSDVVTILTSQLAPIMRTLTDLPTCVYPNPFVTSAT
jgi:hypothetical protein